MATDDEKRVEDTERDGNGKRDAKNVAVARTPGPRDRPPAPAGKGDGDAKAPDDREGGGGEDADRVAAAVGGGDAIGPAGAVGGLDPLRLLGGFRDLMQPGPVARESARLMLELTEVAVGASPLSIPEKDKRFADPAWTENPVYRRLAQSYLAWSAAVDRLADNPELESDWRRLAQARYTGALMTAMAAPTNFLPGNPAALKRAFDTGGLSLARGARNALRDLVENRGMPAQVDSSSFTVGENLAATPGAVIYRDEICEVLQCQPTTPRVRERPLLMIPPQVNKHYFLDLAPGRSFVEYLVGRGVPLFTIVWRNPRREHGHWGLEDYVQAQLQALDVVRDVSGSDDVNLLGACAGGLTAGLMLAHLAVKGDESVNSATFAIAMIDSSYPNSLRLVADKRMLEKLRSDGARGKVYDRKAIATNFAWMRPNDLVFNYVSNDWLMGNDPPAFDILAWNNDGTNLVARFDAEMLGIYADNKAAKPGAMTLLGTPIDLREVAIDNCVIAGQTDHITPWMPCYMTTQRLSGPSEMILTSTGHIQTIVNPPGKQRARYFSGPEPGPDPQAWLREATEEEGSWWPRYADWLLARSGDERDAPNELGSANHPPGDPAPGRYVLE